MVTSSNPDLGLGPPASPPLVSVVVCTLNRLSKLKRCVQALLSMMTEHHAELIIVDNGSTDGSREFLSSLSQQQSDRLLIVTAFQPKRGLAAARNMGWQTATGTIVAFTDDDCYVASDYVDSIVQVFNDDPAIGFVGGRILLFDELDYRITIQESLQRCEFRPFTFIAAGVVQGANMVFRRSVMEQIGGFDERMGAGTPFPCEDIDAVAAALWCGVPGAYDPRPVVFHHHGRRTEGEAQALRLSYDAGRGAYYAKFILKSASRSKYLWAWTKSIGSDSLSAFRRLHLPKRSIRELSSGLRFVMQRSTTRN